MSRGLSEQGIREGLPTGGPAWSHACLQPARALQRGLQEAQTATSGALPLQRPLRPTPPHQLSQESYPFRFTEAWTGEQLAPGLVAGWALRSMGAFWLQKSKPFSVPCQHHICGQRSGCLLLFPGKENADRKPGLASLSVRVQFRTHQLVQKTARLWALLSCPHSRQGRGSWCWSFPSRPRPTAATRSPGGWFLRTPKGDTLLRKRLLEAHFSPFLPFLKMCACHKSLSPGTLVALLLWFEITGESLMKPPLAEGRSYPPPRL